MKTYTVCLAEGESLTSFYTRLANEIKCIRGKIVKMDMTHQGFNVCATLTIEEKN